MVKKDPCFEKALFHWIVFQISHLVAIPFGAMLLGKMFAEVRDMFDDFRVKAGWRSAMYNITQKEGTLDYITAHFYLFLSMSFLSLDLSSSISLSFHLFSSLSFTSLSDEL